MKVKDVCLFTRNIWGVRSKVQSTCSLVSVYLISLMSREPFFRARIFALPCFVPGPGFLLMFRDRRIGSKLLHLTSVNYEDISTGGVWYTLRNNYIAPLWSILHGWTGFESPTVHDLGHRHFFEKNIFFPRLEQTNKSHLRRRKRDAGGAWYTLPRYGRRW
jgi:hypothetical protein